MIKLLCWLGWHDYIQIRVTTSHKTYDFKECVICEKFAADRGKSHAENKP